jgi:hypothetical protein
MSSVAIRYAKILRDLAPHPEVAVTRKRLVPDVLLVCLILAFVSFAYVPPSQSAVRQLSATANLLSRTSGVVDATPALTVVQDDSEVVGSVVTVPVQAGNGVKFGQGTNSFTVGLPAGSKNAAGTINRNGMVTYDSPFGNDNAVVPTAEGAQFLKVLDDVNAPETVTYPVNLPAGGKIALTTRISDTSAKVGPAAFVLNGTGQVVSIVDAPWAKDANGQSVETFFTTDGKSLTQHITHRQQNVAYPVVADPNFRWYANGVVITFTYDDEVNIASGGLTVMAGLVGSSLWTLIGPLVIAGTLGPIVADASWSVVTHQCAWIWVPYPLFRGFSTPDTGYYGC